MKITSYKIVNQQKGMTLIEVMVALAIFSVAALSIVNMAGEHIRSLSFLEQKNISLWIANNHLAQLSLEDTAPQLGVKTGKVEYANTTWFWKQESIKTADPTFRSINIRILDKEKSDYALAELTTYMVVKK